MASLSRTLLRACQRFYCNNANSVLHVKEKQRFEIPFPNGGASTLLNPDFVFVGAWILILSAETASLSYEKVGSDFDLYRTVVPVSQRGAGVAEQLATVRVAAHFRHVAIPYLAGHIYGT